MSRVRTPGDGPKCRCGKPAVWSGWCQMEDGKGFCDWPVPLEMIVTPDQLTQGYLERVGGVVYHREYKVLRELSDGNSVVLNPEVNVR